MINILSRNDASTGPVECRHLSDAAFKAGIELANVFFWRGGERLAKPVDGVLSAAKEKGEKKLFGYSFVPLMQEDGRTLPDGTHELIIQKVAARSPSAERKQS